MSGGYFDYTDQQLTDEIFNLWSNYDIGGKIQDSCAKKARKLNPLEDEDMSELVYDVLCLLHSFDYYKECDTSEETYRNDVEALKKKWNLSKNVDINI